MVGTRAESEENASDRLRGKELIKKLSAEQKKDGWTGVTLHLLMSAMLQEAEDVLHDSEQEHIASRQWQELLAIESHRTELAKFAAISSEEMQKLDEISVVKIITALERQITSLISATTKSVIQHAIHHCASQTSSEERVMKQVHLLVQKCHEEVQGHLDVEEKSKISARQWADLASMDVKKQALSEMTLEAFEKNVVNEKHDLLTYLRAFCEKMIALVPNQSISAWKDISMLKGEE